MLYRVTVRYEDGGLRHHALDLEASDVATALRLAAEKIPPEIVGSADLVELRAAPDPEERTYLGED